MDLRQRVLDACDSKTMTLQQVADRFKVSVAWVNKMLAQRRKTGSIAPKGHAGGRTSKFDDAALKRLRELIEKKSDATLKELLEGCGIMASLMAVHRALQRIGYTLKKSRYGRRSKIARTSKRNVRRGFPR